jgi:hypothetical protein
MADVIEPGVRKVEKSTPQWVFKDQILFCLEKARIPYAAVRTDLVCSPYRQSAYEKDLTTAIYELWGLLGTKVVSRTLAASNKGNKTGYEELLILDNLNHTPKPKQLLTYFRLLSDFVEDLGITRIEEETFKIAPSHKILHGFVKDK